jgi:sec-independent protein translocase protein TatB
MDFLGIGPFEIALVVLIAFIVLGPDRIPGAMRQLGKWVRQLREFTNNITRDYGSDIRLLTGEMTALQEELRSIQRELGQVATGIMTATLPSDLEQSIAPQNTPPIESTATPTPVPPANPIAPPPDPAAPDTDDTYAI